MYHKRVGTFLGPFASDKKMSTRNIFLTLFCAWWVLAPSSASALALPAPSLWSQVRLEPVPQQQEPQAPRIRVPVNEVSTPVTVTDVNGRFVVDLEKPDFVLTDNGAPQHITHFELSFQPLSLVIVVDTSAHVEGLLPQVRNSGVLFTQLVLGQAGEASVMTYDHQVDVKQDFTTDGDLVEKALKELKPGGEQARVSDAVLRAIGMLKNRPRERRKVVVAIGEGRDFGSETPLGQALREAQISNISVYTVRLSAAKALLTRPPENPPPNPFPPGARPLPPGVPPTPTAAENYGGNISLLPLIIELVRAGKALVSSDALKVYAAGTGAAHYDASSKRSIEEAVENIGRELHSQYLLTYNPNNLGEPEFHRIEVQVHRPAVHIRARPGYYYVPSTQSDTSTAADQPPSGPPPKRKAVPEEKRSGPGVK